MKKLCLFIIIGIIVIFTFKGCFSSSDINDESAVIKNMQGTWTGYSQESGIFVHYKLQISENNFKGWLQTTYNEDEPSWSTQSDENGTFKLSPVQSYTNASSKYRNINFYKDGGGYGDNSLIARAFSNKIIYDGGLYVVGFSAMSKK